MRAHTPSRADYNEASSALHKTSFGSDDITVTERTTSTAVNCLPVPSVVNQTTTCTATVSDIDNGQKSWPQGTVTFGKGAASGTFAGKRLHPRQGGGDDHLELLRHLHAQQRSTGTHTITGSSSGSPTHKTSSGTFALTVGKRSTSTSVSCNPLSEPNHDELELHRPL